MGASSQWRAADSTTAGGARPGRGSGRSVGKPSRRRRAEGPPRHGAPDVLITYLRLNDEINTGLPGDGLVNIEN